MQVCALHRTEHQWACATPAGGEESTPHVPPAWTEHLRCSRFCACLLWGRKRRTKTISGRTSYSEFCWMIPGCLGLKELRKVFTRGRTWKLGLTEKEQRERKGNQGYENNVWKRTGVQEPEKPWGKIGSEGSLQPLSLFSPRAGEGGENGPGPGP